MERIHKGVLDNQRLHVLNHSRVNPELTMRFGKLV